jgi:hypothetical protein
MKGYGWPKLCTYYQTHRCVLPRTTLAVSARLWPFIRVITLLCDSCFDEIQYAGNVVNLMNVCQFLEIWTFWTPHEGMCAFLLTCQYIVDTEISGYGLRYSKATSLTGAVTVNCFRSNRHGCRPTTAAAAAAASGGDDDTISCFYALS